ncbi:hypothetical protein ABES08_15085 [Peribacillus simplex]|uniref:hypothetical protein n=1 Tax=Peribacillus simplex TaxID=1478 RepID=UPI003D2A3F2B
MKIIKKNFDKSMIDTISFIVIIISLFFVPTSIDGNVIHNAYLYKNLFFIGFILIYSFIRGKYNIKALIIISFIHLIIWIFTLSTIIFTTDTFRLSLASYSVIIALSLLWIVRFESDISINYFHKIFNVVNIILLIWGFGIIGEIPWVKDLTLSYFSQYSDYTVDVMLNYNKPVISFGTHSIASFHFFMLFLMNLYTIKVKDKGTAINHIFMWFYLFVNLMMLSNTSFILSAVMLFTILWVNKKIQLSLVIIPVSLLTIYYLVSSGTLDLYINRLLYAENNGFIGRYANGLFATNYHYILNYGGIGLFKSPDTGIRLTDSGYIVLLTMGNIPLLVAFFYSFYLFLSNNIKNRYKLYIFLTFAAFEFAATWLILDVRAAYLQLFVIFYINGLNNLYND